jgi:signal transduction histidine kinase
MEADDKINKLLDIIMLLDIQDDEDAAIDNFILSIAVIGYNNIMISMVDDIDRRPTKIRAISAYGNVWENIKFSTVRDYPGDDVLAKVLERRESKYIVDSREDTETDKDAIKKSNIITQHVIPLVTREHEFGTMQIHMPDLKPKPELECKILDVLAAHFSLTLYRIRSLQKLRKMDSQLLNISRSSISNAVASAVMHQFKSELRKYNEKLDKLTKTYSHESKLIKELQKEIEPWQTKILNPLKFMVKKEDQTYCYPKEIIQEVISYWYYEAKTTYRCNLRLDANNETDYNVFINPVSLKEVLSCLIINSLEAFAHNITIQLNYREVFCNKQTEKDHCAIIRVIDDGIGIRQDILDQIFQLGWTSKENGTGMGLSIVKRLVVDQMEGCVEVEEGGTTSGKSKTIFKIIIPTE